MARLGVTYQDIANAANQLIGQGKQPTIELIRRLLGTGSSSTIANHLRNWRQEQDGSLNLAKTEKLPSELVTLIKGLWDRLCHEAQEKINANDIQHQKLLAELQADLQKYKNNNQRWQKLLNQWVEEKKRLNGDKSMLEVSLDQLGKEKIILENNLTSFTIKLQEKDERIAELNRLHALAQVNLEHYREASREQRMLDQQKFADEKHALQYEIKTTKEGMLAQQQKASSLMQEYQLLRQTHEKLKDSHELIKSQTKKQQQDLMVLEKNKNEHQHTSKHWQEQYQQLKKKSDEQKEIIIEFKKEMAILLQRLSASEAKTKELQEQNKVLALEKWEIAQEKAEFRGQVLQMQKMLRIKEVS